MTLSIQECADSIVTRLFTVNWMSHGKEAMGDRIAIKEETGDGERDLGGYCYDAAKSAVEEELREWLRGMDEPQPHPEPTDQKVKR